MADNTDYSAAISDFQTSDAQGNLAAANDTTADQAIEALKLAPQAGIDPAVALADPDAAKGMASFRGNTTILNTHPGLRSFIAQDPTKAAAVKDDMQPLAQLDRLFRAFDDPLEAPARGAWQALKTDAYQFYATQPKTPGDPMDWRNWVPFASPQDQAFTKMIGDVLGLAFSPVTGVIHAAGEPYTEALSNFPAPGQTKTQAKDYWDRTLLLAASAAMPAEGAPIAALRGMPKAGPDGRFGTVGPEGPVAGPSGEPMTFGSQKEAANWILKNNKNTDQIFEISNGEKEGTYVVNVSGTAPKGETPPVGANPMSDQVRTTIAERDADRISTMQETIAASKTGQQAPDLMAEYLEHQAPGQSVWLDPQGVVDLYTKEGKIPGPDDGILGNVPGFLTEIDNAVKTGQPVEVKLSDYLAQTAGSSTADAIREITRFREDGVSLSEAKDLQPDEPVEQPKSTTVYTQRQAPAPPDNAPASWGQGGPKSGGAMSNMLPGEQAMRNAVEAATKSLWLNHLFESAQSAGMTQAQFTAYSKALENLQTNTYNRLMEKTKALLTKDRTKSFQAIHARIKESVTRELQSRRDLRVRHALEYGTYFDGTPLEYKPKLSRDLVRSEYGDTMVEALPKSIFGADGSSADELADIYGFDSGEQMLRELRAWEYDARLRGSRNFKDQFRQLVDAETERGILGEFADSLSPEAIERTARQEVQSPEMESLLADWTKALADRAGVPFDKDALLNQALRLFDEMPMKKAINVREHERTMRRLAQQTETALLKGKTLDAFRYSQQQLLNHFLFREGLKLGKEFSKADVRFGKWATRTVPKGLEVGFLDQIHSILKAIGYPVKGDLATVPLSDFVGPWFQFGYEIPLAQVPVGKIPRDMSVFEWRGIRDMVYALNHVGREAKQIYEAGKAWELLDITTQVAQNADKIGRKFSLARLRAARKSILENIGKIPRVINAANLRPETWLFWLDRQGYGPLMKYAVEPLMQAKHAEADKLTELAQNIRKFYNEQPKGWMKSMNQKVDVPELQYAGTPWLKTRGDVVMMALNMGNESNFDKLARGFAWDPDTITEVANRVLSKADWNFIQHIWDVHESLWPEIAAVHKRISGLTPKRIPLRKVVTPHGTYSGGYFGIKYDPMVLGRQEGIKDPTLRSIDSLFGSEYTSALPSSDYTLSRTGFAAPLSLNFESLTGRMTQIIHDVTHREALIQAQKFLEHPRVMAAIQETLGPEYADQVRPWLEYIARQRVVYDRATDTLAKAIRGFRTNFVFTQVAFRLSSWLLHSGIGLSHAVGEVGMGDLSVAVRDLIASPGQSAYWKNFVLERSGEVRRSLLNVDRDIRESVLSLIDKRGVLSDVEKFGFHLFALSKQLEAFPTWLARYRQAVAKGEEEQSAIALADKAVRDTQGAGTTADLPGLMRRGQTAIGEVGQLTNILMGFFNTTYNRMWVTSKIAGRAAREVHDGEWDGARRDFSKVAANSLWFVIVPAVWYAFERGKLQGKDRQESLEELLLEGIVHNTIGSIPFASMALDMVEYGHGEAPTSPIGQFLEDNYATIQNAWNATFGDHRHVSKRWLEQAANTAGYWTGVVPGQSGETTQYLWDFAHGREHPKDVGEFMQGVLFGPPPKRTHHR